MSIFLSTMPPSRILVIAPLMHDPGNAMRVTLMLQGGLDVEFMAYKRDLFWYGDSEEGRRLEPVGHRKEEFEGQLPDCPVTSLGAVEQRNYLKRIPMLMRSIPKLRAAMRRNEAVYAIGTDVALISFIAGLGLGKPIIFGVMDIREVQVDRGLRGRIVRMLDKFIAERCRFLVLSSAGYRRYFQDRLGVRTRSFIIENKINISCATPVEKDGSQPAGAAPFRDRPLRIGWFARLRDRWSMEFVEHLTRLSDGRFQVVIAGVVSRRMRDFYEFLERNPGLEYRGPYRYPHDLAKLYGSVDMGLGTYPATIPNCWSRSHRYSASCFFQKPLIVRSGTEDAEEVGRHQIGLVLQERRAEDAAEEACAAITAEDWSRWRANMAALPPHVYSYTSEADELAAAIRGLENPPGSGG